MTFFDTVRVDMYLSGAWVDVSADVFYPITVTEGIQGFGPLDRVASGGKMTLILDNGETNSAGLVGYYTPGHTNARTGFAIGTLARVYFEKDGIGRYKFYGRIEPNGIQVSFDKFGRRISTVSVGDWFSQADDHKITLPTFAQNKTFDQVVALIVANMPIAPDSTEYNTGDSTFPFVFDTVKDNTSATAEIQKAAISEFGFCYLKHSNTSGEILTTEGRTTRVGADYLQVISDDGLLLIDNGGNLKISVTGFLKIATASNASFDNIMIYIPDTQSGKNMANRVSAVTYPRKVDASATTKLFELQQPIQLSAGETKSGFRVTYRDPSGAATRVNGREMVTPDTDSYAANTSSDGGGSDISSSLAVTATFGTEGAEYSLTNNYGGTMWVTQLDAIGKGVYLYDPVQYVTEDTDMQATNGVRPIKFSLQYQNDPVVGQAYSEKYLSLYKNARNDPEPPVFSAHSSTVNFWAFMLMNIGDKIEIIEDQLSVNGDYFIQGVTWRLDEGNLITYSIIPIDAGAFNYWKLGITNASELGTTTNLGF